MPGKFKDLVTGHKFLLLPLVTDAHFCDASWEKVVQNSITVISRWEGEWLASFDAAQGNKHGKKGGGSGMATYEAMVKAED